MSIKTRLARLEQRQPASTIMRVVLIPVCSGETKQQATERWQLEHTGEPAPDQILFLIPFGYEVNHEY